MRRKKFTKLIASVLAVSLTLGACLVTDPLFTSEVKAAESEMKVEHEWDFSNSSEGWAFSNWSSSGCSGSASVDGERLKLEADYKGFSDNYNPQAAAEIEIKEENAIDCSSVTGAAIDLYFKEGECPQKIYLTMQHYGDGSWPYYQCGIWIGNDIKTTENHIEIGGETYYQCHISGEFAGLMEDSVRSNVRKIIIGAERDQTSAKTYSGTIYFDNLQLLAPQTATETSGSEEKWDFNDDAQASDWKQYIWASKDEQDEDKCVTTSAIGKAAIGSENVLAVTQQYNTGKDSEWENKGGISHTYEAVQDLSNLDQVSFDFYCQESNKPSNIGIEIKTAVANSGTQPEYYHNTFISLPEATGEVTIDETKYKKYTVTCTAPSDNGNPAARKQTETVSIVLTRKNGINDTVYFDNIVFHKSGSAIDDPGDEGEEEKPDTPDTPDAPDAPLQPDKDKITINSDSSWPWFDFKVSNGGTVYFGTTIKYDVVVANKDFTKLYLETGANWKNEIDVRTLAGSDFEQSDDGLKKHVKITYVGEPINISNGFQVKIGTGDGRTDYAGDIQIKNLTYKLAAAPAEVDESAFVTKTLFTGNEKIAGWKNKELCQYVPQMAENGYYRVEYTADEKTNVRLVLSQWNSDKNWVQVRPSKTGEVGNGTYFAEYSYDACKFAFGSTGFSAVNAIYVTVYEDKDITLTSAIWKGSKVESNPGGNYDSGSTDTSTDDKKETDNKDEDNKNADNKDDNTSSAPVINQDQGQNHSVSGQDFVVTKGGEDGKAEVAFMEAPANAKKVVIPKTVVIDGVTCNVTSIAAEAFKGNTKITSVTIGSNIKKIGDEAFAGCTSLTKVVVPTSVTEIGEKAFYGCKKVQTVTIGKNVKTIDESAFEKCTSLRIVAISGSVEKIESKAFNGCKNLKKIKITSTSLKSVGNNALNGLNKNAVIDVPNNMLKAYKKLFTAKTGFKKTMKLV